MSYAQNLRIEVDAHTHTVMSGHAWSTIQENCAAAAQKGMKALCMTDHGFCMKGTGTIWTPWSFSQLPDVIGGIRVYPGMEFNLWDTEGHLDEYLPGAFQHIRFGIASMHKNVMPVLDADAHTEAYIRAMDHACIDLIGHPGIPSYPIDAERLVRAVAERGRLIEINNNSFVAGRAATSTAAKSRGSACSTTFASAWTATRTSAPTSARCPRRWRCWIRSTSRRS